MVHSDLRMNVWPCGWTGKTVKSPENTCHTWALLQWRRDAISSVCTFTLYLYPSDKLTQTRIWRFPSRPTSVTVTLWSISLVSLWNFNWFQIKENRISAHHSTPTLAVSGHGKSLAGDRTTSTSPSSRGEYDMPLCMDVDQTTTADCECLLFHSTPNSDHNCCSVQCQHVSDFTPLSHSLYISQCSSTLQCTPLVSFFTCAP